MGTRSRASNRMTWVGVVLIVLTGLLNFHVPHFLIESPRATGLASSLLELVFLANLAGALAAAVGIALRRRWGWLVGLLVAAVSVLLWVAQETVGLPGLPQNWLEPSRIVSLIVEGLFVAVALARGYRPALALGVALALLLGVAPGTTARAADCRFVLGFAALHDRIPRVVGQCREDEHHDPTSGDGLQATTNGLLVWRKADNVTAFTNGSRTWIQGPTVQVMSGATTRLDVSLDTGIR